VIAILGDTHLPRGSRTLPPACVELLERAVLIVHTGDFTGLEALRALEALGAPVAAVRGNMDEAAIHALLPETLVVEHAGVRIGVVHDAGARDGRHARLLARFPECDVIAYGHSHQPELAHVSDAWIVNPGSPTERRRAPRHTMALVESGTPRLVAL
jgi:putative phosphoesterase